MEEQDWEDYESGPFCRHWGELGSCDESCLACGHSCDRHNSYDDECSECDCKQWQDADSPDTLKSQAETAFGER